MFTTQPTMRDLFGQLGLKNHEHDIQSFFDHHHLNGGETIVEAEFFSKSQKITLLQMRLEDAEWSELVDEMDARLHH